MRNTLEIKQFFGYSMGVRKNRDSVALLRSDPGLPCCKCVCFYVFGEGPALGNILFSPSKRNCCKTISVFLAFAYFAGALLGAWVSLQADDSLRSIMRAVVTGPGSFFDLLLVRLLPLLFTAFAVYIGQCWLLVPIAFVRAFLFAFLRVGIQAAFGDAGWLIMWLFAFSSLMSMPLLWFFWICCIRQRERFFPVYFPLAALAMLGLTIFDYYLVLPFGLGSLF